jgi:hypothetical protein
LPIHSDIFPGRRVEVIRASIDAIVLIGILLWFPCYYLKLLQDQGEDFISDLLVVLSFRTPQDVDYFPVTSS